MNSKYLTVAMRGLMEELHWQQRFWDGLEASETTFAAVLSAQRLRP
jgi:hypothetical protein